ncbi:MAG: xanthine dehydrogenase small subunit [Bacteroidetes bacterium]|nr:MAG: xanthine dehydrogenase small subunit [Bacteroidota bacterium]
MSRSDTVTFILDGKLHSIRFDGSTAFKPSTTVLNYLRSLDNHKGVKEGCAEGDCGACTVVVASKGENGRLNYEALDSCLVFLPMIHGKQLITVENLKDTSYGPSGLHPVQDLMVTENGSQCGYCTPGFIMSMFALYKNYHNPSREVILDALTGNLCRCTGYQPIVNAAQKACQNHGKDHFSITEPQVEEMIASMEKSAADLVLSAMGQQYFLPASLDAALEIRERYPDAVLVSGATDVALRQTKKNEFFPVVVDLSAVRELRHYATEENPLTFGAAITLEQLKNLVRETLPALYDMLVVFGSLQIRNMATLGGNIGSASPIGDALPLLFAYKAKVRLHHKTKGERTLPIEEFITGYRQTALLPGELITQIIIPVPDKDTLIKSYKVSRRKDLDISTVSAAFALKLDKKGWTEEVILAYGGMAAKTQRATRTETFLLWEPWEEKQIHKAMKLVEEEFTPLSDARAHKEARKIAASNLLLKFYNDTGEKDSSL